MINIISASGPGLPSTGSTQQSPVQQLMSQLGLKLGSMIEAVAARTEILSASQVQDLAKMSQNSGPQQRLALSASTTQLIELQIQQKNLQVFTNLNIKTGDKINIKFETANSVSLLPSPAQKVDTSNSTRNVLIQNELRSSLPKQESMQEVFSVLRALDKVQQQSQLPGPPVLNQQTAQVLKLLLSKPLNLQTLNSQILSSNEPVKQTLSSMLSSYTAPINNSNTGINSAASAIKTTLLQSGLFSEKTQVGLLQKEGLAPANHSKTSSGSTSTTSTDVKSLLQQLNQLLSTGNPLLGQQLAGLSNDSWAGLQNKFPDLSVIFQIFQGLSRPQSNEKPPQQWLKDKLDSGIAKILSQQLLSLLSQGDGTVERTRPQQWYFEIPFNQGEHYGQVQLIIEKEPSPEAEQSEHNSKPCWNLRMNFDLYDLGIMTVHLKLTEDTVNASLWAEEQQAVDKIRSALPELQKNFEDSGIKVTGINCQQGKPEMAVKGSMQSLVDIRT